MMCIHSRINLNVFVKPAPRAISTRTEQTEFWNLMTTSIIRSAFSWLSLWFLGRVCNESNRKYWITKPVFSQIGLCNIRLRSRRFITKAESSGFLFQLHGRTKISANAGVDFMKQKKSVSFFYSGEAPKGPTAVLTSSSTTDVWRVHVRPSTISLSLSLFSLQTWRWSGCVCFLFGLSWTSGS